MRKAGMAKQFIVELDGVVPALIVIGTASWDIECLSNLANLSYWQVSR